jgi:hypothetical protein
METITEIINSVGLPVGLLLVIIFAIYRIAKYAAPLGERVVQEHVIFLDATKMQNKRTVEAIEKQTELLAGISKTNKSLSHLADAAGHALDEKPDDAKQAITRMRDALGD